MQKLFEATGVHALVDGQFGSTGKGGLASMLAHSAVETGAASNFAGVICSNGPNSGHTSYYGQEKIVLKQLPTFAVHLSMMGQTVPAYLSAGAVIDPEILKAEALRFPNLPIFVHPNAAILVDADRIVERMSGGTIEAIASTQSGTGAAIARKVFRDPKAIAREALPEMPPNVSIMKHRLKPESAAYFLEVAQGFSLGLNQQFYPNATSRECTVAQGISDAGIAPRHVSKTYMCIRTFPIRVGNLGEHSSGGWYSDQEELSWEELGIQPEITTVTGRVRRIASFSMEQFFDALYANDPDWVCLSFLDYVNNAVMRDLIENIKGVLRNYSKPVSVLGGFGPKHNQWRIMP